MQTLSYSLVFLNYKAGINIVPMSWDAWGSKESIAKDKQTDRTKHVKQCLSPTELSLCVISCCCHCLERRNKVTHSGVKQEDKDGTPTIFCPGVLPAWSLGPPLPAWCPPACCRILSPTPELKVQFPWSEAVWPHRHGSDFLEVVFQPYTIRLNRRSGTWWQNVITGDFFLDVFSMLYLLK